MSDIVELLQTRLNTPFRITELMNAAADEIEHLMRAHDDMSDTIETLRARVAELEGLVSRAQRIIDPCSPEASHQWQKDARAALAKTGET